MLSAFIWMLVFGFFYVISKRDAERTNTRKDGYWHGWNSAMLLCCVIELLQKILAATGH